MRRIRFVYRRRIGAVALALLTLIFTTIVVPLITGTGHADAQPATWTVVSSPNPSGATDSNLARLSCLSTTACTAVGSTNNGTTSCQPLIEQLQSGSWSISTSPSLPTCNQNAPNALSAVSCTTISFCVAVGNQSYGPLIEELNGSSWTLATPPPISGDTFLNGVSCVTTSYCVAVGLTTGSDNITEPYIIDYNGSNWSVMSSPAPSAGSSIYTGTNLLDAVSCTSTSFCMATGQYLTSTGVVATLTERYDGSGWSLVASPSPGAATLPNIANYLKGITCTSVVFCMAVGDEEPASSSPANRTLTEIFNGTSWSLEPSPNQVLNGGITANWFTSISCVNTASCAAVGGFLDIASNPAGLAETWDGNQWSISNPRSPSEANLDGIACGSGVNCIATGSFPAATSASGGEVFDTLVESATIGTVGAAPTVIGVSPPSGPMTGGTIVTITGTGFSETSGATTFDFGTDNAVMAISCPSTTVCQVVTPTGSGIVNVIASVGGQTSLANPPADQFDYESSGLPAITTVSNVPNQADPTVVIHGSGFGSSLPSSDLSEAADTPFLQISGPSACVFGACAGTWNAGYQAQGASSGDGCTLTIGSWSDSQIVLQANGIGGLSASCPLFTGQNLTIDVWNTGNPGGTSAMGSAAVIGQGPVPTVTSVGPRFGPQGGGTYTDSTGTVTDPQGTVTISGSGFTGATEVWFGPFLSSDFRVTSDSTIVAAPPPASKPEGVSVTIATTTAMSGGPLDCVIIQTGCADAYFYMLSTPFNVAWGGTPFVQTITLGGDNLGVQVSLDVSGSVKLSGTLDMSVNSGIPSAIVANGSLDIASLSGTVSVGGQLSASADIPIPGAAIVAVPELGFNEVGGLFVHLDAGLNGSVSETTSIHDVTSTFGLSYVNGGLPSLSGSLSCNGAPVNLGDIGNLLQCVSTTQPTGVAALAGKLAFPWVDLGPDELHAAIGPMVGVATGFDTSLPGGGGFWAEGCVSPLYWEVEADATVPVLGQQLKWNWNGNLLGPFNLFAVPSDPVSLAEVESQCPMGSVVPTANGATGTSTSQGGIASATSTNTSGGTVSASATGAGSLKIGQYVTDPAGSPTFDASGSYFDAVISAGNSFSTVQLVDCDLQGGNTIEWWDPNANGNAGAWVVASDQSYDPSTQCATVVVNSNSMPNLLELTGSVFGVAIVPKPTIVNTSLSGEGHFRGTVLVSAGTPETDSATLAGINASGAGGTVTYTVFAGVPSGRFPFWRWQAVASGGTMTVTDGVMPSSNPVILGPGIYLWGASYSGDTLNDPSMSRWGSEIEIVAPPPRCLPGVGWLSVRCFSNSHPGGQDYGHGSHH